MMMRNHTTPDGHALGEKMAKFCDDAEPKARLRFPELPPRCDSCAFKKGAHLANGSPYTQMDALKCVLEGREFYCHEHRRKDQLCSGWAMFMLAKDAPDFREMDWDFSNGADADAAQGIVTRRAETAERAPGAERVEPGPKDAP